MTDSDRRDHRVLKRLKQIAPKGAHLDDELLLRGLSLHTSPPSYLSLESLEELVSRMREPGRYLLQTRLGLGDYAAVGQRQRNDRFARRVKPNAPYKTLSRKEQDVPLEILAKQLTELSTDRPDDVTTTVTSAPVGAYDKWEIVRFESATVLPPGPETAGLEINKRSIRSLVPDLTEYRIGQTVTFGDTHQPAYSMLSPGSIRIENLEPLVQTGTEGHRFDVVIELPKPLSPGDPDLEFEWVKTLRYSETMFELNGETTVDLMPPVKVEEAIFSVRLPADGRKPREYWSFEAVPASFRLKPPAQYRTRLDPSAGLVRKPFSDLRPGYAYGIGWTW